MSPSQPPPASRLLPASAAQRLGFFLGVAALALLALVPSGLHRIEGLGSRPAYAAGVAALMALWWLTEAVPIAVTACVPLVLFPVFGVFGGSLAHNVVSSFEPFVGAYVFLFLGGMTIGAGMEQFRPYSPCLSKRGKLRRKVNKTVAHRDHLHIGMTKAGAAKKTSFWTR